MGRTSQFLPFDGLRGWRALTEETRRQREPRRDVDESRAALLDAMLHRIRKGDRLRITWYEEDHYTDTSGTLLSLDPVYRTLRLDGATIRFSDLWDIAWSHSGSTD